MVNYFFTTSASQTKKLGNDLARRILQKAKPQKIALLLALQGELGAGKTTFLQGFAKGLGIKEKVLSPTFIIMRRSQIPSPKSKINSKSKITKFKTFYHLDCYRVKDGKDLLALGFKKIIAEPQNIVAIEWTERIKKILPRDAVKVKFKFINKNTRQIDLFILHDVFFR